MIFDVGGIVGGSVAATAIVALDAILLLSCAIV